MDSATVDAPAATGLRIVDVINGLLQGEEIYFRYVKTAADMMTTQVHKVSLDDSVGDAWKIMEKTGTRHVLVMEGEDPDDQDLVGIVSDRDISRQLSAGYGTAAAADTDEDMLKSSISGAMSRKPTTIEPGIGIGPVVEAMIESKFDALPVVEGREVLGMMTNDGIASAFLHINLLQRVATRPNRRKARLVDLKGGRRAPDSRMLVEQHLSRIEDIMTGKPFTVTTESTVAAAMEVMTENTCRHVPVLDSEGRLAGLVSDREILRALPPMDAKGPSADGAPQGFRGRLFAVDPKAEAVEMQIQHVMINKSKLTTVSLETPLVMALRTMLESRTSALLVTDKEDTDKLFGIVTLEDFMRGFDVLADMLSS